MTYGCWNYLAEIGCGGEGERKKRKGRPGFAGIVSGRAA